MSKITKVEVQAKRKNRVNVYVDDEFFAGVDMDTCVKHGLKAGIEIDASALSEIVLESEKQNALGKAAKYMSRALKTTKQIKDYLSGKGYGQDVIDYCVQKLKEYKYLDDEAYVQAYIKDNAYKSGAYKLKQTLLGRGISKKILDEAFESYKSDEQDIKKLAQKKLGNRPKTYDNLNKVMAYLSGRGFEYDDIKKVINELREGEDDESWS